MTWQAWTGLVIVLGLSAVALLVVAVVVVAVIDWRNDWPLRAAARLGRWTTRVGETCLPCQHRWCAVPKAPLVPFWLWCRARRHLHRDRVPAREAVPP